MVAGDRRGVQDLSFRSTAAGQLVILLAAVLLLADAAEASEVYRLRVANQEHGPIEVSVDQGTTYRRVGKVINPATTTARGYAASVYALPGTVAATAVHGIRIKSSGPRDSARDDTRIISILPIEFQQSPAGFGGHTAGSSGICTDIKTGESIFRNLAPFVGNTVSRQVGGELEPLPTRYSPKAGDVLVITVTLPERWPQEVVIENRVNGLVEVVYADCRERIATVQRPVRGVGRYDATGYTGVGRINTNHTGVVTISTAPVSNGPRDGSSVETRGGFMIQPSRHAGLSNEDAQVMIVRPLTNSDPHLEGMPPLFSGYIGLADFEDGFRVDVKASGSDWKQLPSLVGRQDSALERLGITHIRLRFPALDQASVKAELERSARLYYETTLARAIKEGRLMAESMIPGMDITGLVGVEFVNLYVDGQFRGSSNSAPYGFTLHRDTLTPGEHIVEMRAVSAGGVTLRTEQRVLFSQGP